MLQVLMTRLSTIFATGMVAAQRTNYALCMEFLEGLAAVAGEEKRLQIRQRLLAQASVVEFKARWNLPIYFQLRQVRLALTTYLEIHVSYARYKIKQLYSVQY